METTNLETSDPKWAGLYPDDAEDDEFDHGDLIALKEHLDNNIQEINDDNSVMPHMDNIFDGSHLDTGVDQLEKMDGGVITNEQDQYYKIETDKINQDEIMKNDELNINSSDHGEIKIVPLPQTPEIPLSNFVDPSNDAVEDHMSLPINLKHITPNYVEPIGLPATSEDNVNSAPINTNEKKSQSTRAYVPSKEVLSSPRPQASAISEGDSEDKERDSESLPGGALDGIPRMEFEDGMFSSSGGETKPVNSPNSFNKKLDSNPSTITFGVNSSSDNQLVSLEQNSVLKEYNAFKNAADEVSWTAADNSIHDLNVVKTNNKDIINLKKMSNLKAYLASVPANQLPASVVQTLEVAQHGIHLDSQKNLVASPSKVHNVKDDSYIPDDDHFNDGNKINNIKTSQHHHNPIELSSFNSASSSPLTSHDIEYWPSSPRELKKIIPANFPTHRLPHHLRYAHDATYFPTDQQSRGYITNSKNMQLYSNYNKSNNDNDNNNISDEDNLSATQFIGANLSMLAPGQLSKRSIPPPSGHVDRPSSLAYVPLVDASPVRSKIYSSSQSPSRQVNLDSPAKYYSPGYSPKSSTKRPPLPQAAYAVKNFPSSQPYFPLGIPAVNANMENATPSTFANKSISPLRFVASSIVGNSNVNIENGRDEIDIGNLVLHRGEVKGRAVSSLGNNF